MAKSFSVARPQFIGHLESLVRKTLQDSTITIGELEKDTGIYTISSCRGFKHVLDEESQHNLILFPFRVANSYDYWLSLSVQYNPGRKNISHISLVYYDDELRWMFRADWGNNSKIKHAQPHWHIHNRRPDLDSPLWSANAVKLFPEEVAEITNDKVKNIHFAMAASWQDSYNHVKNLSDCPNVELLHWIDGVIDYVKHQLTYLNDKSQVV